MCQTKEKWRATDKEAGCVGLTSLVLNSLVRVNWSESFCLACGRRYQCAWIQSKTFATSNQLRALCTA